MQNGSDMLVFALFSYIGKYPQLFTKNSSFFFGLMQILGGWQLREFNFVREGKTQFQGFVTKTIMTTVGTLMKILY